MAKTDKTDKKQQITLLLEPAQLQALQRWSAASLIPIAALLRRAIDETLETHKRERP